MAKGGMHGEGGMCGEGGHVWQRGVYMVKGACVVRGGMRGKGGMNGEGEACMVCMPPSSTRYGRSMRGWYASYWNAFLFK